MTHNDTQMTHDEIMAYADACAVECTAQEVNETIDFPSFVAHEIFSQGNQTMYTPKFLRKSAWAVVIGLDDLTVYCELDGKVYRAIGTDKETVFPTFLPDIYPGLFVYQVSGDNQIDVICDFAQLPPFSQEWKYFGDHVMRNPDLACTER